MRNLRFLIALGIAWGMQIGVASAEGDWLDRLSGPGGFSGWYFQYRFLCVTKSAGTTSAVPLAPWERTASPVNFVYEGLSRLVGNSHHPLAITQDPRELCKADKDVAAYFTLTGRRSTSYHNETVKGEPKVHLLSYEVAYVNRFSRAVDASLGMGINFFDDRPRSWLYQLKSADGPVVFDSFSRISITPSIIFAPLGNLSDGPYAHVFTVQAGATVFLGGFRATDFCKVVTQCVDPSWHTEGADFVPMIRGIFDLSQAFK